MHYCISIIQNERDSLKKEILEEIKHLQENDFNATDSTKLQKKLQKLEFKKRKAIDLMLDGLITEDDLKAQTEWYNSEIQKLNTALLESAHNSKKEISQKNTMEKYILALDEIMDADSSNEAVYKEVLDHIDLRKNHVLDIWLKCIPFGIRLKIKASGKREFFKTEILETTFIEKPDAQ